MLLMKRTLCIALLIALVMGQVLPNCLSLSPYDITGPINGGSVQITPVTCACDVCSPITYEYVPNALGQFIKGLSPDGLLEFSTLPASVGPNTIPFTVRVYIGDVLSLTVPGFNAIHTVGTDAPACAINSISANALTSGTTVPRLTS